MEPVRVLHILHSMNRGGAENAIMNYYRHIDRNKVQFDFLLTEPSKCQFEDEVLSLGGRVYRVPQLTIKNPLAYLSSIWRFYKSHSEYHIVHSHTSSKSVFPLLIAKLVGIPVRISHSHGSMSEAGMRGKIRDLLKPLLKISATQFIACGHDAAIWLYGNRFLKKGKVLLFPNVIEAERFDYNKAVREKVRLSLGIKDSTIVLGCTARFSSVKNHSFLIAMFSEFHKTVTDSVLLLVGDGELKNDILELITALNLQDSVILTGVVKNVSEYEQAMDFFLLPSLNEGIPLSLIEAQVSGLRCIVSDGVPGESDKTGLVSFLPLENGIRFWTDQITGMIPYERQSRLSTIIDAGYDASSSAIRLENLYLDLYRETIDK